MIGLLPNLLFYIVPFLVVVGVVVTVHEFGHFLAGKATGTKIDQFSIGFGKAIAHWTDKSGVEWRLGWLPIGGFVRFAGDDNAASVPDTDDLDSLRREVLAREGPEALSRYYHFKPIWQRAVISAAGPVANFVLSIAIFAGLAMLLGEPITAARVARVLPNTPAARGGFEPNDVIVQADGKPVKSFEAVKQLVILRSGVPITFVVDRGAGQAVLTVTPVRGDVTDAVGHVHRLGTIGVAFADLPQDRKTVRYSPVQALGVGVGKTFDVVQTTVYYIGRMVSGHETADQLSGPLGMAQISGDLAKQTADVSKDAASFAVNAALTALLLVANISVGIGFLNLMPIPVLDGGHLLFYAYEAVARRPLAAKVQAAGYRVGLALVLGLMLFATWNDLQRLRVFNFIGGLFS
ncbi:RIP metalloprotease [Phenylobacterium sp.]|uniref:M50 family metallopeptidase n=1 Tax=Phenylobacterium sp. TaxID=1871053 RepID=UPI00122609B6|nr:RIP metalloprotease [Phenylobacterium sp.]THD59762.1 MAG: RIP metalloprotease [Phenylobacterium sp.]